MMTNISGYEGVFDEIFQGKDYRLSEIPGGVSFDIKVKATCEGKDYILKVIEGNAPDPSEPEKRLLWYQALYQIHQSNSSVLSPFWFGVRNGHVVTATDWVMGRQLNEVFDTRPEVMVEMGKKAGKIVRNIHQQEFVKNTLKNRGVTIAPKITALAERLVGEIQSKGITFAEIDKAIDYLNANLSHVSEQRAGIVHNDLRPENFILTDEDLYLFDFDSGTISDCYADFTYLSVMSEKKYRAFSYGVISAYFDNEIPEEFWRVNLVFSIMKLLDYAIYKFNKKGTAVVQQAASFMETFAHYTTAVPTWWKGFDEQYRDACLGLGDA